MAFKRASIVLASAIGYIIKCTCSGITTNAVKGFKGSGVFKLKELTSNICKYGFDQSWTLDGEGNFSEFDDGGTTQTRTVNEANEITGLSGSWIDPAYDAAGNMISGPKSGDETTRIHYVYDAWNRLVAAKADNSGSPGNTIAAYEYDGTNRRVEKFFADDSGVEYFYNRQWQVLDEWSFDDQGETTAMNQYVWSPRYIDAPIVRFHDGNADGYVYTTGVDNTRYYTGDANYNVTTTITIDPNTTETVQHYAYSSYGEATVYDSTWTSLGAPAEDGPLYCGYWFDLETKNDLARYRYYTVSIAAWFTRDPIKSSPNLYEYCSDNPLKRTDPTGLCGTNPPISSPTNPPILIPGRGSLTTTTGAPSNVPYIVPLLTPPSCPPPTRKECDAEIQERLNVALAEYNFATNGTNHTFLDYDNKFKSLTNAAGYINPLLYLKPCWAQKAYIEFEGLLQYVAESTWYFSGGYLYIYNNLPNPHMNTGPGDVWAMEEFFREMAFIEYLKEKCKDAE